MLLVYPREVYRDFFFYISQIYSFYEYKAS